MKQDEDLTGTEICHAEAVLVVAHDEGSAEYVAKTLEREGGERLMREKGGSTEAQREREKEKLWNVALFKCSPSR